jgi:hypothetical protein
MLEIVKQLYCFSVFFERLLAARIAGYSSDGDARILTLARRHLHEEIGHADMFRECLAENGVDAGEIAGIAPKLFTKALFGYLEATLRHENEYVANVALIQVMESIGFHFFGETLPVMERHGLSARALEKHVEDDADHPWLGLELIGGFDEATWEDSLRIVRDLYRLMAFTLDEWLAAGTEAA